MFYWVLKWIFLGPLIKAIFRPRSRGTENVPDDGAVLLACNHLSYSDWLFMPLAIPRRVTFVAKSDYWHAPGIKGRLQRWFFSGSGQIPIDRSSGKAAAGALKTQLRLLKEGHVCGIFPEGTRSHDGKLYRGRTGVARLALEAKVPVVPVGVIGTDVVAPPGKVYGRYTRPTVIFGEPLDFSRYDGMEDDRFVLRSITDEIMYEIMELSGQEYVDMYATTAKELAQQADKEARAEAKAEKAEAREAKAAEKAAAKESAREAADEDAVAEADLTPEADDPHA